MTSNPESTYTQIIAENIRARSQYENISAGQANLRDRILTLTQFKHCNFEQAQFNQACLFGSSFDDCNLDDCNFAGTVLSEAVISNGKGSMKNIIFSYMVAPRLVIKHGELLKCNFSNANLSEAKLLNLKLTECLFPSADLSRCFALEVTFEGCIFTDVYMWKMNLEACKFINCQFIRCTFIDVNFVNTSFVDTTFEHCIIKIADFSENAQLDNVTFINCVTQHKSLMLIPIRFADEDAGLLKLQSVTALNTKDGDLLTTTQYVVSFANCQTNETTIDSAFTTIESALQEMQQKVCDFLVK